MGLNPYHLNSKTVVSTRVVSSVMDTSSLTVIHSKSGVCALAARLENADAHWHEAKYTEEWLSPKLPLRILVLLKIGVYWVGTAKIFIENDETVNSNRLTKRIPRSLALETLLCIFLCPFDSWGAESAFNRTRLKEHMKAYYEVRIGASCSLLSSRKWSIWSFATTQQNFLRTLWQMGCHRAFLWFTYCSINYSPC